MHTKHINTIVTTFIAGTWSGLAMGTTHYTTKPYHFERPTCFAIGTASCLISLTGALHALGADQRLIPTAWGIWGGLALLAHSPRISRSIERFAQRFRPHNLERPAFYGAGSLVGLVTFSAVALRKDRRATAVAWGIWGVTGAIVAGVYSLDGQDSRRRRKAVEK